MTARLAGAPAPEASRFFAQRVRIPERGEVTSYVLILGTNRFSFMPPASWRVKYETGVQRLVLTPPDLEAGITVAILTTTNSMAATRAEVAREQLLERFPGARITSEAPCYLSSLRGVIFDLERPAANRTKLITRLALVSYSGGMLEFAFTAAPAKSTKLRTAFANLLTSFRVQPNSPGSP